ncbi:hypothetical protein BGZ73_000529 [Actinomortierella ambigua]|nr:hypothetical protein BGZ73_000529 [Actinomortierella ambigua]
MDIFPAPSPSNDDHASLSRLESLPPECFDHVLDYLADDCIAMHSLMLLNKILFSRTVPRLYQSPFAAIEATWPRPSFPSRLDFSDITSSSSTQEPTTPTGMPGYTSTRRRSSNIRLGQSQQVQLLWVFFNCLLHYGADRSTISATSTATKDTLAAIGGRVKPGTPLEQYRPSVDYLAYYTHMDHPGLRFVIIQLFPDIDDASDIEYLLVQHATEGIRTLFLDWLQMDRLADLVPRFSSLVSLKLGQEDLEVQSVIDFVEKHQQLYGTIMELDIEAYLPSLFEAKMDPAIGQLINTCRYLRSLSLSGFEMLTIDLNLVPTTYLRTLRINCGQLGRYPTGERGVMAMDIHQERTEPPMSIGQFLSRCRSLEHLMLRSVHKGTLDWAVQERRAHEAAMHESLLPDPTLAKTNNTTMSDTSSVRSFSSTVSAATNTTATATREGSPLLLQRPVALRTLHISGMDSEQAALVVSQAAEAFADTLESIEVDSFSYQSNPTLTPIAWKKPLPRLWLLRLNGRSNLPFHFASLDQCPNLHELDLFRYVGMRGCSETELLHLQSLKHLARLDLFEYDHLTDWTLDAILSRLESLQYLRVSLVESTGSMTTARGTPVASNCPCRRLSAAAIAASLSPLPIVREDEGGGGGGRGEEGGEGGTDRGGAQGGETKNAGRPELCFQGRSGAAGADYEMHDPECPFSSGPSRNGIMSLEGILASVDRHLLPHLKQLAVVLRRKLMDEHLLLLSEYSARHPELEVVPYRGR